MAVNSPHDAKSPEMEEEWEAVHYSTPEMEWETHEGSHYSQPYSNPELEWETHESHYTNPYSSPELEQEWETHESHYSQPYSNPETEWQTHYSTPEMEEEWEAGVHYSNPEEEGEQFLSLLGPLAARALPLISRVARPAIRRLLPMARQAAPGVVRSLLGRAAAGDSPSSALFRQLSSIFGQGETEVQQMEAELFGANEFEGELAPHEVAHEAALTEVLAAEASHTESESEAEALLGAALPITITIMGGRRPLRRVQPTLVQANARLVRSIRRSGPAGPQLLRTVPSIQRRTVASLKAVQRSGRPVTPTLVNRVMAGQAARVLSTPHICGRALARNSAIRQSTVARPGRRVRPPRSASY